MQILIDVAVPETKNTEAGAVEVFIPRPVTRAMRIKIMLLAIEFDDKTMLQTHEVDDVTATRCLAAKMKSLPSPGAKMIPDFHFLRR